jgi:hypothetical protein
MSQIPILEEFRRRIASIRERIKVLPTERRLITQGQVIGEGKVIETIQKTVDNIISMAKEKRPNIIPTVMEKIKTYQPGKRIMELLPTRPTPSPAPSPAPTYTPTPERRMLRK